MLGSRAVRRRKELWCGGAGWCEKEHSTRGSQRQSTFEVCAVRTLLHSQGGCGPHRGGRLARPVGEDLRPSPRLRPALTSGRCPALGGVWHARSLGALGCDHLDLARWSHCGQPFSPFPPPQQLPATQAVAGAPAAPTPSLCLRSARPCCGAVGCEPVAIV